MNEATLTRIASAFLKNNYHIKLDIPIRRNNRLRATYGRFMIKNRKAWNIELAGILLDYGTDAVIKGILKHECIHYALYEKRLPYRDGQSVFENELKKHHVPSTHQLLVGKFHMVRCAACGETTWTNKKRTIAHPDHYKSGCCMGNIEILGERIFNGENDKHM